MTRLVLILLATVFAIVPMYAQAAVLPPFELRVPVLMYHRIDCEVDPGRASSLFLCPARLDAQMALLKARGWHSITSEELAVALASRTCLPPKTFVIHVDSGWLDGYTNGAPIWEKYGFRATFYMVVGYPAGAIREGYKPHFSFAQARDLLARGHTIGNHTWSHASLGGTPSQAKLDLEVTHAQDVLEAEGLVRRGAPRTFVYPGGAIGAGVVEYLTAHGYAASFSTKLTTMPGLHSTDRPQLSPRLRVVRTTTPKTLLSAMRPFDTPCTTPRPTPTPMPSPTPTPTVTSTPSPTATPEPTATLAPTPESTPTPSASVAPSSPLP